MRPLGTGDAAGYDPDILHDASADDQAQLRRQNEQLQQPNHPALTLTSSDCCRPPLLILSPYTLTSSASAWTNSTSSTCFRCSPCNHAYAHSMALVSK